MKHLKILAALMVLPAWAHGAVCPNNEAIVILDDVHSADLVSMVGMLNSMPLGGAVRSVTNGLAEVSVTISEDYAKAHQLNSFDVASKIASIRASEPARFGIKSIQAETCYGDSADPEFESSNVGTIGHGH
jgi:hypothetical protein